MRKILMGQGGAPITVTATTYFTGGRGAMINNATESVVQSPAYFTGTANNAFVGVRTNTTVAATTVYFRVNGVNGHSVTIPAGTTGLLQSTTGSDSIASTDLISFYVVHPGAGNVVIDVLGYYLESEDAVELYESSGGTVSVSAASTNIFGQGVLSATNNTQRPFFVSPGEMRNLSVNVTTNTRNNVTTVAVAVNTVVSALSISIPASTSGTFQNISTQIKLSPGDRIAWSRTTTGTSGTFAFNRVTSEFYGLREEISTLSAGRNLSSTNLNNTVYAISGSYQNANSTNENAAKMPVPANCRMGELRCVINSNAITNDSAFTFRLNSADTALLVNVPASTTGTFTNLSDWVSVSAGDFVNYRFTRTGGSNFIDVRTLQVTVEHSEAETEPFTAVSFY